MCGQGSSSVARFPAARDHRSTDFTHSTPMSMDSFRHSERWRRLWDAVAIVRPVHYSLFTFGESELLYWLVQDADRERTPVRIARGEVRVTRPLIITPDN